MNDSLKKLQFNDAIGLEDKKFLCNNSNLKTKIILTCHDTGEVIWEGTNKLILPGAGFVARSLFDLGGSEITPSYNSYLGLDNTVYTSTPVGTNKTCLFCVGTDGCGSENSQVWEVDYRKWIQSLVPFQYRPQSKDLNSAQRGLYFGRKTISSYFAYYFKGFDSSPQLVQQFTDGTPIDSTIYSTTSSLPVETYVTMTMSLTKYDCRDYFIDTTSIKDARINTISLCTGWYTTSGGYRFYQDIRPVTKLNFPNEPLIDLRKGIDITYQVYF